ncbi:MAG: cupin [Candidatus Doudnabacteria bacterium RIFCSPLOWO2_02_FULL_49_13]|uniref:Cupin n=1 Tax=Candidatus Doudnabacteria bacterium RIFCSPHIGHO2_12_FULL_48_16 TaxID=1817838 RepID=A0A1F5PJH6_9BACT|nr:MAG: cupin [Candidatus Doudnabacteria bacterium RIFCSPHIGHO2_02_FULL_49_24]OGE89235.1 MAG: cupin [Candidatus Doudnabacteria bacterium RIFCSPHIGHO2_01_FULL_50_67]OGE90098.1 MAG: cupin [Candidatus Doudnabacteria bacterium RIFCSPHIGHO2_12_FULL_48_16]OGE97129.1 MAG: cupin [Candidatus Doudnabacteria bacterium RIFCSPLOWO2_01_FULL_49_40]OGF03241.1 MAG: cupin [Candidatus Doudnabacteria bacterium RIFCSPLOWO2_02_FULL_49_13]OGF03987.1 MAG: cupin [Candidatus Doudnabacteria bacterium RIFCSPLOWO2_12_FULL
MKGYKDNIERLTLANENFRQVLYTAKFSQLVLMSLKPGEEIGEEIHEGDQFFRLEKGQGRAAVAGASYDLAEGDVLIVPAGCKHNIINVSTTDFLKLYTLYSPPHHRDGVVHVTKQQAETDSEQFEGRASE